MRIIIGIDGGGTKTRFMAYDIEAKKVVGEVVLAGTDYQQDGFEKVIERLKNGVSKLQESCRTAEIEAISFGMPRYSECPQGDEEMARRLKEEFGSVPWFLFNDVYIAFEGAFYGKPGILAVAGTGSLAYGRGEDGLVDRCGGWSDFFGDEGSGFWIGKKLLEIFSKQSDGRREKSPLYELTRQHFGLEPGENDFKILSYVECKAGDRAATAALNLVVKKAADAGDLQAREIYTKAVGELADMISSLYQKLECTGKMQAAFYGGLFQMEEYITVPLTGILENKQGLMVVKQRGNPCLGAVVLAIEKTRGYEKAKEIYEIHSIIQ